jgi:hypothetical protein
MSIAPYPPDRQAEGRARLKRLLRWYLVPVAMGTVLAAYGLGYADGSLAGYSEGIAKGLKSAEICDECENPEK